jgi:DNA polymerase-3 subunit epsilon
LKNLIHFLKLTSAKLVFDILQVYSFFQKDDNYDVKVLIRCICKIALKSLKNLANTMVNLEKIVNTIKSQNEKSLDFSSFSDDEKLLYSLYVTYSNFQTLLNDNQPDIDKAFMDIVRLSLFSGYKESIPNESEMRFAFRKHKHFLKKETVESKLNNIKTEFNENIKLGSLSYLYKKVIIFDLETSGLNPLIDNIIEVAMIILTTDKNGNVIKKEIIDELVKLPQGKRISDKIIELTGITNEDLAKDGKDSVSVINNLCSMMLETEKIAMFAYNASFDLNFLYNFFKLQNLEYLLNLSNIDYYDCLTIYKDYAEYPHKLKDAINHFNLQDKVQNTHRAIDDANSTLEIIKSMVSINDNLTNYVNLFGYNPKYPINMHPIIKIKFLPQPYNSRKRLYEK